jgi:hypothetical protein
LCWLVEIVEEDLETLTRRCCCSNFQTVGPINFEESRPFACDIEVENVSKEKTREVKFMTQVPKQTTSH